VTIPKGFFLPDATLPDKTTGKMGKMHGERIVIIPAKKEKPINRIIV
jgi:hypothetical protein